MDLVQPHRPALVSLPSPPYPRHPHHPTLITLVTTLPSSRSSPNPHHPHHPPLPSPPSPALTTLPCPLHPGPRCVRAARLHQPHGKQHRVRPLRVPHQEGGPLGPLQRRKGGRLRVDAAAPGLHLLLQAEGLTRPRPVRTPGRRQGRRVPGGRREPQRASMCGNNQLRCEVLIAVCGESGECRRVCDGCAVSVEDKAVRCAWGRIMWALLVG